MLLSVVSKSGFQLHSRRPNVLLEIAINLRVLNCRRILTAASVAFASVHLTNGGECFAYYIYMIN